MLLQNFYFISPLKVFKSTHEGHVNANVDDDFLAWWNLLIASIYRCNNSMKLANVVCFISAYDATFSIALEDAWVLCRNLVPPDRRLEFLQHELFFYIFLSQPYNLLMQHAK